MKLRKIALSLTAALLAVALLAGCGGTPEENRDRTDPEQTETARSKEPVTRYTAENEMFAISLPGEWSVDDNMGMPGVLSLSGENDATVLVMGLTKASLSIMNSGVESLEDFYTFAEESLLNGAAATSELASTDAIPLPGFAGTIAMAGKMTQSNGASGTIFVQCAESKSAYYFIAFSAASKYDETLSSIRDNMVLEELALPETGGLSDTLKWFNGTYAVITTLNGGDLNYVAGYEPGDMIQQLIAEILDRDWGVTDRASLNETIDWALTEGHNAGALSLLADLEVMDMSRDELIAFMEEIGFAEDELTDLLAAYDAETVYGENAIAGWDLSRAMSLMGWGYLAGYYTYEEAMDRSLETARRIQQAFDSWDDFFNSYFYGYSYWSEESLDDPDSQAYARHELYERLKSEGAFPAWDTPLEKEW